MNQEEVDTDGLMQFEIARNTITAAGPRLDFVWVRPPVQAKGSDRYPGCSCAVRYEVVEAFLPSIYRRKQEQKRRRLNTTAATYVCACVGKLIE